MPSVYQITGPSGTTYRVPWNGPGEPTPADWDRLKASLEPSQPSGENTQYVPGGPVAPFDPTALGTEGLLRGAIGAGNVVAQNERRQARAQRRRPAKRRDDSFYNQPLGFGATVGSALGSPQQGMSPADVVGSTLPKVASPQETVAGYVEQDAQPTPPTQTQLRQLTPGTLENLMFKWDWQHKGAPHATREAAKKGFAYMLGQRQAELVRRAQDEFEAARGYGSGRLPPGPDSPAGKALANVHALSGYQDPTLGQAAIGAAQVGKSLIPEAAASTTDKFGQWFKDLPAGWATDPEQLAGDPQAAQNMKDAQHVVGCAQYLLPGVGQALMGLQTVGYAGQVAETGITKSTVDALKGLGSSVAWWDVHNESLGEGLFRGLFFTLGAIGIVHGGLKLGNWWAERSAPGLMRIADANGIRLTFRQAQEMLSERDAAVAETAGKLGQTPEEVEAELQARTTDAMRKSHPEGMQPLGTVDVTTEEERSATQKGKKPRRNQQQHTGDEEGGVPAEGGGGGGPAYGAPESAQAPQGEAPQEIGAAPSTQAADEVSGVTPTETPLSGNPLSVDELRDIEDRAPTMDDEARKTHLAMLDEHRTLAETYGERIARVCFGRGGGFTIAE